MSCTLNATLWTNPWLVDYTNGTTVYCDPAFAFNHHCNATFNADADIAGDGVVISFIFMALLTVLVSSVQVGSWLIYARWRDEEGGWDEDKPNMAYFTRPERVAQLLLDSLCDVQLLTGIGIIVAGFAQIGKITFYHQDMIVAFWWLCQNSFWAARRGSLTLQRLERVEKTKATGTRLGPLHGFLRLVAMLVGTVLAVVFLSIAQLRETQHWDPLRSGACYLSGDRSDYRSNWLWIASLILFAAHLSFVLARLLLGLDKDAEEMPQRILKKSVQLVSGLGFAPIMIFIMCGSNDAGTPKRQLLPILLVVGLCACVSWTLPVAWWCTAQFLAFVSWGEVFPPLEFMLLAAFAAWNSYDIIDMKIRNKQLVVGTESSWGFGQVLPLMLLLWILFSIADAFQEVYRPQSTDERTDERDPSMARPGIQRQAMQNMEVHKNGISEASSEVN